MIKVAIMGYGTVGSGVYEVFRTNKTSIDKKVGQELRVQYVLDLREFPGDPVMDVLTHDFEDILNDDEVKIVRLWEDFIRRMSLPDAAWKQEKVCVLPTRNWWLSMVLN